MKKITQKEINKLSPPLSIGRTPKNPQLYQEIKEMKKGEKFFMSKKEWKETGYSTESLVKWWVSTRNNIRDGHRSSLANIELKIKTYQEGWVVEKL